MGVDVVVGGATAGELAEIEALFEEWDRTFSTFRDDSELARYNAGKRDNVSALLERMLSVAYDAYESTGGLVDPSLGGRDTLDLNGVVKGLAADEALALVGRDGFVSAGGDVAVRGGASVELPGGEVLRVTNGAIATSGTTRRGAHLVDPRTGKPPVSPWTEVTVAAFTCLEADVAAKAAFILGDDGPAWLDLRGLAGRFRAGERVVTNQLWNVALGRRAAA
jgi:thiamine biosynthesis lipoprotein